MGKVEKKSKQESKRKKYKRSRDEEQELREEQQIGRRWCQGRWMQALGTAASRKLSS
jgi:hypothetical protein